MIHFGGTPFDLEEKLPAENDRFAEATSFLHGHVWVAQNSPGWLPTGMGYFERNLERINF